MHQAKSQESKIETRDAKPETRDAKPETRSPHTNTNTIPGQPRGWRPGCFDHEKLDAFQVARQALARGDQLARALPRGYGSLKDQLRRALLSAYLGVAEAANRTGKDRQARFRCARAEHPASEYLLL
jgi:hypothetical protein